MGADKSDDEILDRIRGLLDAVGVRKRPVKFWAGKSEGGCFCAACGGVLRPGDVEWEIVIGEAVSFMVDRHCYDLWMSEVNDKP